MFDAYTVKKVMPRLLIAVVLIQLSWFIFTGMINLTTAVAYGVEGLIYAPFKQSGTELSLGNVFTVITGASTTVGGTTGGQAGFAALAAGGAVAGGAAAFATGSVGVLFAMAGTVLLSLLIGFFVLVLRQVVILALLVVSPIALVLWILPNTEKYWKLWWESFSKLLLMFPMILAMIAAGRAFGYVAAVSTSGTGGAENVIKMLIVFLGFFGPFFLIPKTFQLAGSMFANLTGMVNDKGRGGFDRLKNYRGRKYKENWAATKSGNKFKGGNESNFRGRLNTAARSGALVASGAAGVKFWEKGRIGSAAGVNAQNEMAELMEKNADIKAVMPDDHLAEAVQYGRGKEDIRQRLLAAKDKNGNSRWSEDQPEDLARAVALVERAQRAGSTTAVNSAMTLARAQSGTGYANASDMHEAIIDAAGGDRQLEGALLAGARSASERARRPDLAGAGHVDQTAAMESLKAAGPKGSAGRAAAKTRVDSQMRAESMRQLGAHGVLNGRPGYVKGHTEQLAADFNDAKAKGDVKKAAELAAQIKSLRDASGSAPPAAREHVAKMLQEVGVDTSAVNPQTGQARSTDEQLGEQIGLLQAAKTLPDGAYGPIDPRVTQRLQQEATQEIRTLAGAYDAGGSNLTPEQIEMQRFRSGGDMSQGAPGS